MAVLGLGLAATLATLGVPGAPPGPDRELATRLGLTDPCLATEARYTRHPTQADLFAPRQDGPGVLDRMQSGALLRSAAPGGSAGLP